MTNKNVSQLPTNSTPQDSDWLLGASGDSPSVFQKIPVGSLIPSTKNSGSIKFSLPINQNTALTSSGYYFTNNIAANIGIDCSGLGIGEHISWLNLSTQVVVFYGLSTVNGVTIPANQGVRINPADSIDFFLLDANHNIKIISGSYVIHWIPGQEPPSENLTYSFNNDTNDLFYYLGTAKRTLAWVNPTTRTSLCTISAISWNQSSINSLTDRLTGLVGAWNQYGPEYTVLLLNNNTFTPNKFVISAIGMGNNPLPGRIDLKIRAFSSDPWTTIAQVSLSTKEIYYVVAVSTGIRASEIRLSWGASPSGAIPEIYLYGTFFF